MWKGFSVEKWNDRRAQSVNDFQSSLLKSVENFFTFFLHVYTLLFILQKLWESVLKWFAGLCRTGWGPPCWTSSQSHQRNLIYVTVQPACVLLPLWPVRAAAPGHWEPDWQQPAKRIHPPLFRKYTHALFLFYIKQLLSFRNQKGCVTILFQRLDAVKTRPLGSAGGHVLHVM